MVPIIVKRREGDGGGEPSSKINIRPWAPTRMKDEIATDKKGERMERKRGEKVATMKR